MATPFFSIITLSVAMETSSGIWPNFKLIQALTYVILTCKYEIDPINNSQEKVATPFFQYKSMGILSHAQGQLTPSQLSDLAGDREPMIVNISHESKSVRNSEAAIWQWMCLIG